MTRRPQKPESEAFKRFFDAYPKRSPNPRYEAWRVFDGLVTAGEDPEALIGAAERFAAEWRKKGLDAMFVPHARTWLRQRRFEDYAAPEAPAAEDAEKGALPLSKTPVDERLNAAMTPVEQRAWLVDVAVEGDRAVIGVRTRFATSEVPKRWGAGIERALGVTIVAYEVRS